MVRNGTYNNVVLRSADINKGMDKKKKGKKKMINFMVGVLTGMFICLVLAGGTGNDD